MLTSNIHALELSSHQFANQKTTLRWRQLYTLCTVQLDACHSTGIPHETFFSHAKCLLIGNKYFSQQFIWFPLDKKKTNVFSIRKILFAHLKVDNLTFQYIDLNVFITSKPGCSDVVLSNKWRYFNGCVCICAFI